MFLSQTPIILGVFYLITDFIINISDVSALAWRGAMNWMCFWWVTPVEEGARFF